MIYVFYGVEEFLIHREVEKILKEHEIDSMNLNTYDLENTNVKDIVDDASTMSLFSFKKAIVVENSYLFTGTTTRKLKEQDTTTLECYFQNPNPNTILIFTIIKESLDKRKKIFTLAKKFATIKELNTVQNPNAYIKEILRPYQMEDALIPFLIQRVGEHFDIIEKEIEKLKVYKGEDKVITKEDIINVTCKTVDIDIFHLIDQIIEKNIEKVIESYYEMLKLGEEPIKIIILLANQFRIMYQAKEYLKQGYSEKDIATQLEIHPYRVKLALSKSRNFSSSRLLQYLEELADLDFQIKGGKVDKNIGLELFLLAI